MTTSFKSGFGCGSATPRSSPIAPLKTDTERILSRPLAAEKGPPGRLADVGRLDPQPLLEAAVARHGGEHAPIVVVGRVENDPAVRREAGRLVALAVGQGQNLLALEVHGHQL